jgi:hypothetical protein
MMKSASRREMTAPDTMESRTVRQRVGGRPVCDWVNWDGSERDASGKATVGGGGYFFGSAKRAVSIESSDSQAADWLPSSAARAAAAASRSHAARKSGARPGKANTRRHAKTADLGSTSSE